MALFQKEVTQGARTEAAEKPPKANKARSRRRWVKWLGILVILAAAAYLAMRFLLPKQKAGPVQTEYAEAAVQTRTISSSISGSGTLQPANAYTVTTLVEGEILTADFEEGDVVDKDAVLYQIDNSGSANNIEKSQISLNQSQRNYAKAVEKQYVTAPISGRVYSLNVAVGDEVSQNQVVAVIRDSDTMLLTVPFPADDAQTFFEGQTATITLDGSFETLTGTVQSVSGSDLVGDGNIITRNVKIAVSNPGGLSSSQAATANINGIGCAASGTFEYRGEMNVTAPAAGTVTAIRIPEGNSVSKGQTILTLGGESLDESIQSASESLRNAQISMENTQSQLDNYTVTSPIQGTIVDKQYKAGDTASNGATLCTIYDLSYLEMTIDIDELDIDKVATGQSVQVSSDALEGKTFRGTITKVSVVGTTSGGVTYYPATVRIEEYEGLRAGMNVDAEIIVEQAQDVPAIPSAAITRGGMVLITADSPSAVNALEIEALEAPEGYVYVRVETGVSDDSFVEIVSGLQEGDTVAYRQSSASGASAAMTGMPGMGMMPSGMGGGMPGGGGFSGGGMPGGMGGTSGNRGGMSGGGGRP